MKNLKHTPGPWKIKGESHGNYITVGTENQTVCKVNWGKTDTDYDFYNAKLISQAPQLLDRANQLLSSLDYGKMTDYQMSVIYLLEESIKKATV